MFIAHLPAGLLLGGSRFFAADRRARWAAVIGALIPDLDMLRFVVDHGAVHHHRYFSHLPGWWLAVALVTSLLVRLPPLKPWRLPAFAFFLGVGSHLVLDSVVGDIAWLWPFSDRFFHLFSVANDGRHWIVTFVMHPSFLLELGMVFWAVVVVRVRNRSGGIRT